MRNIKFPYYIALHSSYLDFRAFTSIKLKNGFKGIKTKKMPGRLHADPKTKFSRKLWCSPTNANACTYFIE